MFNWNAWKWWGWNFSTSPPPTYSSTDCLPPPLRGESEREGRMRAQTLAHPGDIVVVENSECVRAWYALFPRETPSPQFSGTIAPKT